MRSLITWNPYQELTSWHRDIDELFRRFFPAAGEETSQTSMANFVPSMEVFEKDGQYIVRADLPGVDPKEIDVSVVNDSLVLKGERKRSNEVNEEGYQYTETSYGRFERRVSLPTGVEPDKIAAKFENGVLEISVPLPANATAKKIPIESSAHQPKQIKAA